MSRQRREEPVDIPMTPLIDAVFLLLIFFLVATMIKKKDRDIEIDLPESVSAIRLPPDDARLVIGIDRAGTIHLDGVPAGLMQLHAVLREVAEATPERQLRLDVDAETPVDRVVEVVNLAQFRGLKNIGVRTYDERSQR